ADLQTQLTNSQIQLATLQNDYDLLHQAYEAHRTQHSIFKSRELDGRLTILAGDLTSIAPLIAEIPNYSGQILPDEWYQGINKILTLPAIIAAAFNDALRAEILKSKMAGKYTNIPAQHAAVNIQNKSHSDSSSISRAELDSIIKSQLALVPTTSIQVPDKYMPERPPDGYGVNSEKFIHCDLINPTPSASQIIESLANDLYKK
ncbi:8132_t:CDS:2, partial [Cetraspora pellucida]